MRANVLLWGVKPEKEYALSRPSCHWLVLADILYFWPLSSGSFPMKISGFTFVRNAEKLYIPVKESIQSVLPLCDEFIVALGKSDDDTEALIRSIDSEKIKIVETEWDTQAYPKNTEYAHQTDIAKGHCTGDWLIYIQSDEALHEQDYPEIKTALQHYFEDEEVEGFLFNYLHFWGDFAHVHQSHAWYKKEIRIIRNKPEIHSWRDAQSFRYYGQFTSEDYREYLRAEQNRKLRVVALKAQVYHYGFARPPHIMSSKKKVSFSSYHGAEKGASMLKDMPAAFDYGPLDRIPVFKGTHPACMRDWISRFDWQDQLYSSGKVNKDRLLHGHERLKNRLVSFVENKLLGGRGLFEFKNYELLKK